MMVTSRQRFMLTLALAFCLMSTGFAFLLPSLPWRHKQSTVDQATIQPVSTTEVRNIHLFTVEYRAKIKEQQLEAYRWDPGNIIVYKGEKVRLHLHGFNGKEHHFSIPAFHIRGTIKKGEIVVVDLQPNQIGTFELICHTHLTPTQHGPMIGYISVVNP